MGTPGKVIVIEKATGIEYERWPVDARTLVASGEYVMADTPTPDAAPDAAAAPTSAPLLPGAGVPLVLSDRTTAGPATPATIPAGRARKARG